MIVISATAIPDHLRGALTRWLLEVTPELYVGTVSARVRDELWTAVAASPEFDSWWAYGGGGFAL